MFEEVGIYIDMLRLEVLVLVKMGMLVVCVSASGGARETLASTFGARDGVMSMFGFVVVGVVFGLFVVFVIGVVDNVC